MASGAAAEEAWRPGRRTSGLRFDPRKTVWLITKRLVDPQHCRGSSPPDRDPGTQSMTGRLGGVSSEGVEIAPSRSETAVSESTTPCIGIP
jgi:hypothetical protein